MRKKKNLLCRNIDSYEYLACKGQPYEFAKVDR